MRHTDKYLKKVATYWVENQFSYCDEPGTKKLGHDSMKKVLRDFAENVLLLGPSQFEVRSNLAGIAVSGEVTLHTDAFFCNNNLGLYLQVYQGSYCTPTVIYRSCRGRTDFTGFTNRYSLSLEYFKSREKMKLFWERTLPLLQGEWRSRI